MIAASRILTGNNGLGNLKSSQFSIMSVVVTGQYRMCREEELMVPARMTKNVYLRLNGVLYKMC